MYGGGNTLLYAVSEIQTANASVASPMADLSTALSILTPNTNATADDALMERLFEQLVEEISQWSHNPKENNNAPTDTTVPSECMPPPAYIYWGVVLPY